MKHYTSAQPPLAGYEIHAGVSVGPALARPLLRLDDDRDDGVVSDDAQIAGSYVHGLFDLPQVAAALLHWAGLHGAQGVDRNAQREAALERLADACAAHLDLPRIFALLGLHW